MSGKIVPDASKTEIPGLLIDRGGISFSTHNLTSGDHFFVADDFRVVQKGEQLVLLFGTMSHFSDKKNYNLAIEICFPIRLAVDFLYKVIWENDALSRDTPLVAVVEDFVLQDKTNFGVSGGRFKDASIPSESSNYRKFPANFASCSISHGQALLEFFEASPDMIVSLLYKKQVRPNSGVKNIVSVIMSPTLILDFFKETKAILEPLKQFSSSENKGGV